VVLTIIALIAVLVGPRLIEQLDRSKVTAARVQIRSLASSLETMRIDIGRYPTAQEGLDMLVHAPTDRRTAELWRGPYLDGAVPSDPWGGAYTYALPAGDTSRPVIVSLGADGREGGTGLAADVRNGDKP
jgi:general secretion pathway protein G